uniref:Uncharacterized protein n=1 Tax=Helianthus annuus TaxID=4232 RepID=A0A251UKX2_HELAN
MVYRKLVNYLPYWVKLRTERINGRLFQVFPSPAPLVVAQRDHTMFKKLITIL